ncbi:protein required for normal CLN1 and CLN2 G1 cyclin expression [Dissophora globulifera]|uniref:Protein required for normal CLN1 and CLN2 G1 cyclin expression n=1 Tax=Dissophora globulifera TaxID=979702 RepID=A0A9P6RW71_9FUNG|nr:protein required for normal CLN1 and CLN2 G1 cyclin expression [Dissophora globulifera]
MYHPQSKYLEIPIRNTDNVLEIARSNLPSPSELFDIFKTERAPLKYYVLFSLEFARQKNTDAAIKVLVDGLSADYLRNVEPHLPLHNLLACLYIRKAYQSGITPQERNAFWSEATRHLGLAERINPKEDTTWITKDEAYRHFKQVLIENNRSIPAILGVARILFIRENYGQALNYYRSVLKLQPDFTPNPRIGMGLCFYKLGMDDTAQQAFERCVEMNADDATAHVLLAILCFNKCKRSDLSEEEIKQIYRTGFMHLKNAYTADKKSPVVGLYMAKHFVVTQDTEKAMAFATKASNSHGLKNVQAEGFYTMGRIHHQQERYVEALACYGKAVSFNPENLLAQFGLGQTLLFKQDVAGAISAFERILSKQPKCVEAIAILGSIYSRSAASKSKALEFFDKATNIIHERNTLSVQDPLMFTEMAQLLEQTDTAKTSKAYMFALGICGQKIERGEPVEYMPELLNNVAAITHMDGRLEAAEGSYNKALEMCAGKDGDVDMATEATITTIRYNLARLYEDRNEIKRAEEIYKDIANKYHGYADAHLRLGVIEQSRGNFEQAAELYKDVFGMIDNKNVDAWTLMGMLQQKQNQIRNSRKTLERIVKEINRHDVYALLALGNNHLGIAREEKDNMAMKQELYKKAFEFFDKVLKIDAYNAYAANGIAISLAVHGHHTEAREMFLQLREAASAIPTIWLNLALVSADMGQYRNAVLLYASVSKKFFNNEDENVILSMAKAQYCLAKQEKSPEKMLQALTMAQRAYRLNPSDKTALYDIALIQQSYAQLVSDRAADQRTVEDINHAMAGLGAAKGILKSLIAVPAKEHVYYEREIAAQREKHGDSLLTILQRKLKDQEIFEADRQKVVDETRKKREAEKAKKDEEKRIHLERQDEEERDILERRRALDQGAKETQRELDEMNRERAERKRMTVSDDDASDGDMDATGEREVKKQKKERKQKEPREPKEPKEPKEPRKGKLRKKSEREGRARSRSTDRDRDEDDGADDSTSKVSSKKYKSKENIDSDEDDLSD